jgi:phospholipid transport system substrate-binding protein
MVIMKTSGVSLAVAATLLMCFSGPSAAVSGGPTDQIRGHVDEMYRLVSSASSERSASDSQAAVRKVADRMFDWPEMARGALGKHWQERTSSERDEFVRLFAAVFERAYLSKIQLADAEHFTYLGEAIEGEHARVRTTVTAKNGSVVAVDYRTRVGEGGSWRVYDLDAEGISLVGNYRTQFNSIIARSSYFELVKRLKAARESHSGG